jgi:hypothetical protein
MKKFAASVCLLVLLGSSTIALPAPQESEGFNCVFMGHSFFKPMADGMPLLAQAAGITNHTQI